MGFSTIKDGGGGSGGGGGGWEQGVNQVTLSTSGDLVGIGVAPTEKLHVDGAIAMKTKASAPSAAADYAKLYSSADDDGATVLLCHFEGSDGAQTGDGFVDASSTSVHTVAIAGGSTAQIDTAAYAGDAGAGLTFSGSSSSILLDGNSDYLTVSDSTDFDWTGAFTVECFVRFNSLSGEQYVMESAYGDANFFRIRWDGANNDWELACVNTAFQDSDSLSTNTWYHLALTRDGSNVTRFYRDGVQKATTSGNSGTVNNTSGITIGSACHVGSTSPSYAGPREYFNGWIDEVRIKKGVAEYSGASSFTPPQAPLGGTTTELYAQDSAGNATKLSPHNSDGDWEYFSKNSKTGKTVRINMEEVVSDLGKLTGKNYIKDE
tara:strand:- start:418 stop:1548 length:1131 start_codon:yes stop_codon:yes gene_type:complete